MELEIEMPNQPPKGRPIPKPAKAMPRRDDFVSVAKALECDEDKAAFEAKLGKLAKAKPAKSGR
jgi:hypothetical protein